MSADSQGHGPPPGDRGAQGFRPADDAWRSEQVDALFGPWDASRGRPGAAVRVIRDGTLVHARDYGLANIKGRVPLGQETAFLLASLTKPFTALAVLVLVEKGRLGYDSRLSDFFPDFPDYAREVAVRHLLRHTSGLREFEDLCRGRIDGDWFRSAESPPSAFEPTTEQIRRLLAWQKGLRFAPGERCEYSNSGYAVLARIIEVASGRPYAEFLREAIFAPLGMDHSVVPVAAWRAVPGRATSYTGGPDGPYRDIDYSPLNLVYGEDGVYTTAADMVTWDRALYGDCPVRQSTLEEAFRPGRLNDGSPTDCGYGWFVGPGYVDHSGEWAGFRTYIRRYPGRRFTVIVLANCREIDAAQAGADIARLYLETD
jgi:CubicO group peptidase (beta-lactamase class C family)